MADSQQETEAFSLTAHKELNSVSDYRSLDVYPSPVKLSDENPAMADTLIVRNLEAENPAKPCLEP